MARPCNKFESQLLDSLGPATNLEKIFCAHIGNYTKIEGGLENAGKVEKKEAMLKKNIGRKMYKRIHWKMYG